ncbi:unnamed protein product, partial [Meganyctiphanes norvegica]
MVYNFSVVNDGIELMQNKIDAFYINNTETDTQLQNILLDIGTKIDSEIKACTDTSKSSENIIANINDEVTALNHNITEVHSNIAETLMDIKDAIRDLNSSVVESSSANSPVSCGDLYNRGIQISEPVQIYPYKCCPHSRADVLCEQSLDLEGPWTVIQRRQVVEPRENFYRTWNDYARGFGKLDGEFWVGLNVIHELTFDSVHELHIELEDWGGNKRSAKYSHFSVGSAEENYKLKISGYSGDAGDAMTYHNGQPFSTRDRENDEHAPEHCAE